MTIEERADELYSDEGLAVESRALNSLCKKGYIAGAIDQRAYDIEEACEYLKVCCDPWQIECFRNHMAEFK